MWTPHGLTYANGEQYPPSPSHSTSSFIQICRLTVIFNEILIHMYDPTYHNSDTEMHSLSCQRGGIIELMVGGIAFLSQDGYIRSSSICSIFTYRNTKVCSQLCYNVPMLTISSLLYYCFRILLYRPMLSRRLSPEFGHLEPNPNHLRERVSSATAIIAIFDLYHRTFGESHCTISVAYCVYIASSIFLLQVQATPSDHQAARRLEFCPRTCKS